MSIDFAIAILVIAICFKWGDWRNWRLYYPTILYFIIGDVTGYVLLHNTHMWLYDGWTAYGHFMPDIFFAVFVYPFMIIMFLTYYPEHPKKKFRPVWYILFWVVI